jgi:hypothetical protein
LGISGASPATEGESGTGWEVLDETDVVWDVEEDEESITALGLDVEDWEDLDGMAVEMEEEGGGGLDFLAGNEDTGAGLKLEEEAAADDERETVEDDLDKGTVDVDGRGCEGIEAGGESEEEVEELEASTKEAGGSNLGFGPGKVLSNMCFETNHSKSLVRTQFRLKSLWRKVTPKIGSILSNRLGCLRPSADTCRVRAAFLSATF